MVEIYGKRLPIEVVATHDTYLGALHVNPDISGKTSRQGVPVICEIRAVLSWTFTTNINDERTHDVTQE
jgi:hypothetical protein